MRKKHKNSFNRQDEGFVFYVKERVPIPPVDRYADHHYVWENYMDQLGELVELHHEALLTLFEISKAKNIPYDTLKALFEANDIKIYHRSEIAKMKREKHFELLYDLHFNKKMSLNEIERKYGFSRPYIKRVFEDKGIKHLNFLNQHK
jgi:site-specific DNA recombinase